MTRTAGQCPERYRANVERITRHIRTDVDTAVTVLLMTSALMDLSPDDPKVAEIILDDCKAYADGRD